MTSRTVGASAHRVLADAIVLLVWGGIRLAETMQQGESRSGTDPAHGEAEPSLA